MEVEIYFFDFLLILEDDGISGITFERKGFQAMIAEIEAKNVSAQLS